MRDVPETFPAAPATPSSVRRVLLWDGSCGFCRASARLFARHMRVPVRVRPVQEVANQLPAEVAQTATDQVLWIDDRGAAYGGALAVAKALEAAGWKGLGRLLGSPWILPAARRVYRWVADRRNPSCRATP